MGRCCSARSRSNATHEQRWDAKTAARIAKDHYGSFKAMFEAHGWPERGAKMMTAAPKRSVALRGFKAESSTRLTQGVHSAAYFQIELLGGTVCRAPGHRGIGGK